MDCGRNSVSDEKIVDAPPVVPEPKEKTNTKKVGRKKLRQHVRAAKRPSPPASTAKYPRHTIEKALRIPKAIIDQNAGRECSEPESARYVGVGFAGPYRVELSSALKYGFLSRPRPGVIAVTDRARQAIRPQKPNED